MLPLLDQVFDGSSTTAGDASPVSASTALSSSVALAVAVAGVSVVAKELLFRWTLKVGEKLHSQVLIANAWHHRSDALSSVVACGTGSACD